MTSATLAAMQRDFRAWLLDGPNAMAQRTADPKGLAVYHNAYRVQLCECLHETFGKLAAWLGDDAFLAAARQHIETRPPHGWTLGIYGDGFDATLATLYPDDPEVAELAWLDWALCRAFDGPDAAPMPTQALQGIDWEKAVLRLVPTLQVATIRTNAGAIWSALAAGEQPPAPALLPAPGAMLVWRQEFTPCFRTIAVGEQEALARIAAGASFGDICALLAQQCGPENSITQAGTWLGQWLQDGLVCGVA